MAFDRPLVYASCFTQRFHTFPGAGSAGRYMLLGTRGETKAKLQLADFRIQSGLYILYGNYGPYYVGKADRLGRRLKQHLNDRHARKWNRFSWFVFAASSRIS